MQKCFDTKNAEMLQEVMNRLHPEVSVFLADLYWPGTKPAPFMCVQEAKFHLRRCVDSGLWVPESGGDEETDGEGEDY